MIMIHRPRPRRGPGPHSDRCRRWSRALLLAGLVLLLPGARGQESATERSGIPKPVVVEPLGAILVDREFTAPAQVLAANRSELAAEVAAVVATVHFDVGAEVEADAVLVTLDATDYRLAEARAQASLQAAEARIRQAELRLQRARALSEDGFVSADELLARETELDVARAEKAGAVVALEEAREAIERTTIEAPFPGTITERFAQVGAYVVPGARLVTLVEHGTLEIDAEVPPETAPELAASPRIRFEVRGRAVPARLLRLSPVIDPQTRVQRARLAFAAEPMPAGTTGTLRWLGARGQLPADLLVQREGTFGVFVAENGVARFVALPRAEEGRPAATELPDDTPIVIRGARALQPGDPLATTPR